MFFESILCGLTGFLLVEILMKPYEALEWWPVVLRRALFGSTALVDYEEMKWWHLAIYKPLAGCGKCFAGWLSLVVWFSERTFIFPDTVFFVVGAILTAWTVTATKERLALDN